jgi:2-dehydro-3-deoxyphosphogluconate aldolase/(4S)-4-hydroxy-2-oxoglutarate aldolase
MTIPTTDTRLSQLIAAATPLIPVLHVESADHAEPLAEALVGAGLIVLEVTLRTASALDVISRMRKRAPNALIGAGTLTKPEHFERVKQAGALFAVSPALTPRLAEAAAASGLPFIPGAVTPSEVLFAREYGFHELKFFPADLMGGVAALKHLAPLYPDIRFCPTGGISDVNVNAYLDLGNVFAAGGAWLAPRDLIEAAAWEQIAERARRSVEVVAAHRRS